MRCWLTQFKVNFERQKDDYFNDLFYFRDGCPICLAECFYKDGDVFSCKSCKTEFKILQYDEPTERESWFEATALIEVLNEN